MLFVGYKLSAVLVLFAALIIVDQVHVSQAFFNIFSAWSCSRDSILELASSKLMASSTLFQEYNDVMENVVKRYEEAEESGLLAGMDDIERENYYRRLAVTEFSDFRRRIESGQAKEVAKEIEMSESDKELVADCYDPDALVEGWNPDDAADLDGDLKAEFGVDVSGQDATEAKLKQLEEQARSEDEMGLALSPEAREALKMRAKTALYDLLTNEVRQIALAIISAYVSGSAAAPVVAALGSDAKYKIFQYLVNAFLDIVSSALGRKVEIFSPSSQPTSGGAAKSAPKPSVFQPARQAPSAAPAASVGPSRAAEASATGATTEPIETAEAAETRKRRMTTKGVPNFNFKKTKTVAAR